MIFQKDQKTENQFAETMKNVAWVILCYNCFTVFPYFYESMPSAEFTQRIFGSASATALMMGIESSTLTAIFNPKIIAVAFDKPKNMADDSIKIANIASRIALFLFIGIAAYTFWFDYQINLEQIGAGKIFFLKVLAGVFVFGSEIAFACANIFTISASNQPQYSDKR